MENKKLRKVLLVADIPGWAFDHRAKDMMAQPSEKVKLDLKYGNQVKKEDAEQYDLIYPMAVVMTAKLYNKGIPINKMAAGITSMRQFSYILNKDKSFKEPYGEIFEKIRGLNTASDQFVDHFSKYRPVYKTRVGIDEKLFSPLQDKKDNPVFTVGWAGSSTTSKLKGFKIVEKALEGLNVKIDIRTRKQNYVNRQEMVKFYQGLDCFICSSRSEHIPLPILEAASCGVPIISTKVGIVPELINSGFNGIIVNRNAESIREAVLQLMNNPEQRRKISSEIRKTILKDWTWEKCWKQWEEFFSTV